MIELFLKHLTVCAARRYLVFFFVCMQQQQLIAAAVYVHELCSTSTFPCDCNQNKIIIEFKEVFYCCLK